MKRILQVLSALLIAAILFSSCDTTTPDYPDPRACFIVDGDTFSVDQPVYFNNCSDNAEYYDWEFGDGYVSNEKHPTHSYTEPGSYQVRLNARGYGSTDTETKIITIGGVTELDILVLYLGSEDPVSNCGVTLYGSEEDWQNFDNPIMTDTTNSEGLVLFSNLDPQVYYMDAYRHASDTSYYSNELQGVTTEVLTEDETNYYTVYVELLYTSSKPERGSYVIRQIKKRDVAR